MVADVDRYKAEDKGEDHSKKWSGELCLLPFRITSKSIEHRRQAAC